MCQSGRLIILGALRAVWDCFLLWILRALDFTNSIKIRGKEDLERNFLYN